MSVSDSTRKAYSIYFIQVGSTGPIKIGRTSGPVSKRLAGIQTSMPFDLKLIATIPDASFADEKLLHKQFDHLRIRGEWFHPAEELLDWIASEATPHVAPRSAGKNPLGRQAIARTMSEMLKAPLKDRDSLWMRLHQEGFKPSEIAKAEGVSKRTVNRRLQSMVGLRKTTAAHGMSRDDENFPLAP